MKHLFSTLIIILLSVTAADAATITAANCSSPAVQAAINSAATGDTVVIPAASCTWTSGVSVSDKGIVLRGAPTTITNNLVGGSAISITEDATIRTEVSHINFLNGSYGDVYSIDVGPHRAPTANDGKAVLLHDLSFTDAPGIRLVTNHAVIYNITATTAASAGTVRQVVHCSPAAVLTDAWTTASTMGTADATGEANVYLEDSRFTRYTAQVIDVAGGCRIVIRHNTFDESAISSHGADTETNGLRHFELYDNTFLWTNYGDCDGSKTINLAYRFFLRGGTGIITANTGFTDMSSCAWGTKVALNMTVMNLQRNSGPNPCWGAAISGTQYPAPRQIGLGRVTGAGRDGLGRSSDSVTYVGDSEPLYIWNQPGMNPGIGDYGSSECSNPDSSANYIILGRDYFVGTAKPGWTKYPYPHPLRSDVPPSPPTGFTAR